MIPLEQRDILQQLHIGHFGIEKTKQRARDAVYWPRMNTDIESLIARCSICQEHQWAPQKEPMVNRPIPTRPFQMVAVDLFECDGNHYLSLQDSILHIVWRSFKTCIVIFVLNQTHSNAFSLSAIVSFMIALQQTK